MRKTQGTGRRPPTVSFFAPSVPDPPSDIARVADPSSIPRTAQDRGQRIAPRDGVTMDYQMGFTSGPSN
jgi:hypothetical protein